MIWLMENYQVVVRMCVDESGRQVSALGDYEFRVPDFAEASSGRPRSGFRVPGRSDLSNSAILNYDICGIGRRSGPINQAYISKNQHIVELGTRNQNRYPGNTAIQSISTRILIKPA